MRKKGQIIMLSTMIFLFIFLLAMTIYLDNLNTNDARTDFGSEAEYVGQLLMSEGYPTDWKVATVEKVGLLTSGELSEEKLDTFKLLIETRGYEESKSLIGATHDYTIIISDNNGVITAYGHPLLKTPVALETSNYENIGVSKRLTILKGEPVTLGVYIVG